MKWYATKLEKSFKYTKFYKARNFQFYNKTVIVISSFVMREAEAMVTRGSCSAVTRELYLSGSQAPFLYKTLYNVLYSKIWKSPSLYWA